MKLLSILFIFEIVFILNYEGYHDIPKDPYEALMSEPVPAETRYCDDMQCVDENLLETGTKHLKSIYKITYYPESMTCDIEVRKVTLRPTIEDF